jgi:hypothetical protein
MVGYVEDSVFLHRIDDRFQIILTRWHIFQDDTILDTLAVGHCVAHAESVEKPRAESISTYVLFVLDVIAIFATILVNYTDAEHVPDDISPVVKRSLGNIHTSADICITEPSLIQFLERDLMTAIDSVYHPNILAYQALSSIVVNHIISFFVQK